MRSGNCPKCKSADIIRIEGYSGDERSSNLIHIGLSMRPYVNVPRYVCGECGFTEEWIDLEDLARLKKKLK